MRLSSFGKLFGAAAVFAAASTGVFLSRDALAPLFIRDDTADRRELGGTARSLVYRVPKDGVITFNLSRPSELVRIISQPNIAPEDWTKTDSWTYGFGVVMRDADGAVIFDRAVYSRALHPRRLRPFKRPVRFRLDSDIPIALRDETVLAADRPVSTVELTALDAAPGVLSIDVQASERLPFVGNTALAAFRRRSSSEQAILARADALGLELMTDQERAALMTNRWRAMGPTGIAGSDYEVSVVYERPYEVGEEEE